MSIFACVHQDQLVKVAEEVGREVYECPKCPMVEWRQCIHCRQVNIRFPSVAYLCDECSKERMVVWNTDPEAIQREHQIGFAEACIHARQQPSLFAFDQAFGIRARARKRLGLPELAKVPRKIEDICARILRINGCWFYGGYWSLPNSDTLSAHF